MPSTNAASAAYARISKDRPDLPKVADQLRDCIALASAQGYAVPVEYAEEPGTSATKGKPRPSLDGLIEDVLTGKYGVVLAVEQSRFNRSVMDNEKLMAACFATGTVIHTVRDGMRDPGNDADEFISTMFAARDRMESRRIARRVRAANDHLVARRRPIITKRPFGYEKDGMAHRPEEAKWLRWAIDHLLGGGTTWQVMKKFRAEGLTPVIPQKELDAAAAEGREPKSNEWTYGSLDKILLRPGTYGLLVHRGEVVGEGDFDGIGTPEEYDRIKALLSNPERSIAPSREPRHLMSGLVLCGTCGGPMFRTTQKDRHRAGERLAVYRCQKPNKSASPVPHATIMQNTVDEMVKASIASRFLMIESAQEFASDAGSEVAEVQRKLGEVREEKEFLVQHLSTPGFRAQFAKQAAALHDREQELLARLDQIAADDARSALSSSLKAEFWQRVHGGVPRGEDWMQDFDATMPEVIAAFDALPLEQRRSIVRATMRVTVGRGQGPLRVKVDILSEV